MGNGEKKPLFKRVWFWVLVIIVLMGIGSCDDGSNEERDELVAVLEESIDSDAAEVVDRVTEMGYEATCEHDDEDWTDRVADEGDGTLIVVDYSYDFDDKTVTLEVETKAEIEEEQLEEVLDSGYALDAVIAYGEQEYRYGFSIGTLQRVDAFVSPYDDSTWSIKSQCTITNAYDTEGDYTVEARVTGTTDDPEVVYFEVY